MDYEGRTEDRNSRIGYENIFRKSFPYKYILPMRSKHIVITEYNYIIKTSVSSANTEEYILQEVC